MSFKFLKKLKNLWNYFQKGDFFKNCFLLAVNWSYVFCKKIKICFCKDWHVFVVRCKNYTFVFCFFGFFSTVKQFQLERSKKSGSWSQFFFPSHQYSTTLFFYLFLILSFVEPNSIQNFFPRSRENCSISEF